MGLRRSTRIAAMQTPRPIYYSIVNNVRMRRVVFVWSQEDVYELEERIKAAEKLAKRRESTRTLNEW
jgi:hypothetical protein